MFCDLHMHSTASDGTDPPEVLATLAREAGLAAIALTDHDTTAGLPACAAACRAAGVDLAPGIEVSCDPRHIRHEPLPDGRLGTLHMLGLFIRHDEPRLHDLHLRLLKARQERNPRIIQNLNDLGVRIDYQEVIDYAAAAGADVVGRPHIAQVLVQKGYVKSIHDAFARYIGEGAPAHARKDLLPPAEAVAAIHQAGGLAILAHPSQLRCPDPAALEHVVSKLKSLGLDGLETRHPDHAPAQTQAIEALARRFNLLTSGGSDYHGSRKSIAMGSQRVPLAVFQELLRASAKV